MGLFSLYKTELTEGNRMLNVAKEQAEAMLETVDMGITVEEGKENLMGKL